MSHYAIVINALEAIIFTMVIAINTPRDIINVITTHKDKYVLTYQQQKKHNRWLVSCLIYVISSIVLLRCLSTVYQDNVPLSIYAVSGGCIALFTYRNKRIADTISYVYQEKAKDTYITRKMYGIMLAANDDLKSTIASWYVLCALQAIHSAIVLTYTLG